MHVPAGVNEGAARGSAETVVSTLARTKAEAALGELVLAGEPLEGAIVLGADTVVAVGEGPLEEVLGKPVDREDARRMLARLLGRAHRVHTGVAVASRGAPTSVAVETTRVSFRALASDELERHLDRLDWEGKAGAYGIQGEGARLLEALEGCYYNVVGLPLVRVAELLACRGLKARFACDCASRPCQVGASGCGRGLSSAGRAR